MYTIMFSRWPRVFEVLIPPFNSFSTTNVNGKPLPSIHKPSPYSGVLFSLWRWTCERELSMVRQNSRVQSFINIDNDSRKSYGPHNTASRYPEFKSDYQENYL